MRSNGQLKQFRTYRFLPVYPGCHLDLHRHLSMCTSTVYRIISVSNDHNHLPATTECDGITKESDIHLAASHPRRCQLS